MRMDRKIIHDEKQKKKLVTRIVEINVLSIAKYKEPPLYIHLQLLERDAS